MFDRILIKEKAKDMLRKSYWKPFLVSLILALISGGSDTIQFKKSINANEAGMESIFNLINPLFILTIVLFMMGAIIVGIIIGIFIFNPIQVGASKFFINYLESNEDVSAVVMPFKGSYYLNIVKSMFLRGLFIFLWSLLLVIPGIIMSYSYRYVPYILAKNPSIDAREALDLSRDITKGYKMDLFIMDLSFIGWYILGALALGIGVFFVNPYRDLSIAISFNELINNAKEHGLVFNSDFMENE